MKTETFKKLILAGMISALAAAVPGAQAATFNVTGQLTGDLRPENPDNLIVDVTIAVTDFTAQWLVDINSPAHPDIKLDEFYFNLANLLAGDVTFGNYSPAGWAVQANAGPDAGIGGTSFMFEALDPPPLGDHIDVTNDINLTFTATLNRLWTLEDFLNAATEVGNDNAGSGQMGAHLLSLGPEGEDSGFAFGNYKEEDGGGPPIEVAEPTVLALMGIGLLSLAFAYPRRVRA